MDKRNIEYYKTQFFKNKPIHYQLRDDNYINIFPILVEDWEDFENNYGILTIDKREINIPEIVQMSYLDFIVQLGEEYRNRLRMILSLTLHEKESNIYFKQEKRKIAIIIMEDDNKKIGTIKTIIKSKDFDTIKKIILYQNIVGYDDTEMSADIKKVIQKTLELQTKNMEKITLEDKMIFVGNKMGLKSEELLKMTYRELSQRFDMAVSEMDYVVNRTAELSGNVKFNKPIEHLFYKKHKNKWEQYFVDKDSFSNKINNA